MNTSRVSIAIMPADRTLATKPMNGRSPKMGEVPKRLRHVHSCIRRSCQKSSEAIGENGQQAKPIHTAARLLIPENSKSPDTPMTQVTKGQSGWGFTVKHGATSQHRPQSAVLRSEPLVCQQEWIEPGNATAQTHVVLAV